MREERSVDQRIGIDEKRIVEDETREVLHEDLKRLVSGTIRETIGFLQRVQRETLKLARNGVLQKVVYDLLKVRYRLSKSISGSVSPTEVLVSTGGRVSIVGRHVG